MKGSGTVVPEMIEKFVEELLVQQIVPLPVAPGILCMKQATTPGECGKATKDVVPDVGRCSPACPGQVQETFRRELLRWELELARSGGLERCSRLQKAFWISQIKSQMSAWPELKPEFDGLLVNIPSLREVA